MNQFLVEKVLLDGHILTLGVCVRGMYQNNVYQPRITVSFQNGQQIRRMPLAVTSYQEIQGEYQIKGEYAFNLSYLYFRKAEGGSLSLWFSFAYGEEEIEPVFLSVSEQMKTSLQKNDLFRMEKDRMRFELDPGVFVRKSPRCHTWKDVVKKLANGIFAAACRLFFVFPVKENRIVFISNRRDDLTGNFQFVYEQLVKHSGLDIRFVLKHGENKKTDIGTIFRYMYYCATSRVILVDDYIYLLYKMPRRAGTLLFQFWHACGAFKTFGFSRLDLPGGQVQESPAHRNYDYTIVSSKKIARFYEEAFAMSPDQVLATGVPRTDIFFSETYREQARKKFYDQYSELKNRKILLFAPTFRGNGKHEGYYPPEHFDPAEVYEALNEEYVIIVKHHPYVKNRPAVPEKYKEVILDLSDEAELNDLLFVTDLLVTDYSSVIFEAALLDIPMILYAFDLEEYLAERGFYYEYEYLLPGKKVTDQKMLVKAVKEKDFEEERRASFKERFFDQLDGKSSERVASFLINCIKR